jgi:hypothetical protein
VAGSLDPCDRGGVPCRGDHGRFPCRSAGFADRGPMGSGFGAALYPPGCVAVASARMPLPGGGRPRRRGSGAWLRPRADLHLGLVRSHDWPSTAGTGRCRAGPMRPHDRLAWDDVADDGCIITIPCGGERAGRSPVDTTAPCPRCWTTSTSLGESLNGPVGRRTHAGWEERVRHAASLHRADQVAGGLLPGPSRRGRDDVLHASANLALLSLVRQTDHPSAHMMASAGRSGAPDPATTYSGHRILAGGAQGSSAVPLVLPMRRFLYKTCRLAAQCSTACVAKS